MGRVKEIPIQGKVRILCVVSYVYAVQMLDNFVIIFYLKYRAIDMQTSISCDCNTNAFTKSLLLLVNKAGYKICYISAM